MPYPLIFSKYVNVPLLATADLVNSATTFLLSNSTTLSNPEALSTKEGKTFGDLFEVRDNIGIINIVGPIFRYGKVEACSVVYGTQHFSQILAMLEKDSAIENIVLNFDTGGGEATGISELAEQIKACSKPTTAYIDGLGASAGYWLASACDRVVANETALVGSVGVVFAFMDTTKMQEKIGVEMIEIVSTVSPSKRLDIKTDEGRAKVQVLADDLASIFVTNIAGYRNVTMDYVKENFGKGDVMIASKALEAKMIDEICTFEALITRLQGENMNNTTTTPIVVAGATEPTTTPMSADAFKTANPTAYQDIFNAGATAERERIKAIAGLNEPHYQAVIKEHMFNGTSSVNDAIVAIYNAKQTTHNNAQVSFAKGGQETADAWANISTTHTGNIGDAPEASVRASIENAIEKRRK